jgi:hypothetical protein
MAKWIDWTFAILCLILGGVLGYGAGQPQVITKTVTETDTLTVVHEEIVYRDFVDKYYVHRVRFGQTLYGIAKDYYGDGDKCTALAKANDIADPSMIVVGQKLVVPMGTTEFNPLTQLRLLALKNLMPELSVNEYLDVMGEHNLPPYQGAK